MLRWWPIRLVSAGACMGPPFSSLDLIRDVIRSDSTVVGLEGEDLVDRWQTGRPAIMGSFFIRMYCSMPFIPDDRKLLCCQDAGAEIEGRSNISIFQIESHWNELVKMEKRGKMRKNPLVNKWEQTKIPFSFAENPPSSFPFLGGGVLQQQSEDFFFFFYFNSCKSHAWLLM